MADSPQPETNNAIDLLEPWRELREAYVKVWAKSLGEAVNSDEYAKTSGALLETALTAAAPFRDAQKKVMVGALEQLNMPSRAEFLSLAERMTHVEVLLDDMDAKLTQIHKLAVKAVEQSAAKPAAAVAVAEPTPRVTAEPTATKAAAHAAPIPSAAPTTTHSAAPSAHKTENANKPPKMSNKSATKGSK